MIKLQANKITIINCANNNHINHHKRSNKIKNNKILIVHMMMTMMKIKMMMIKMIITIFFGENNSLHLLIALKFPTNKFHYLLMNNRMAD